MRKLYIYVKIPSFLSYISSKNQWRSLSNSIFQKGEGREMYRAGKW